MTKWRMAAGALACLAAFGAAKAQTAAPAPKTDRPAGPQSGLAVTVQNSRSVDLTALQVAAHGSPAFKKVLGRLKAGQKAAVTIPKGDCRIDLEATFADGQTTEAEGVDVCAQKLLNLTE